MRRSCHLMGIDPHPVTTKVSGARFRADGLHGKVVKSILA